MKAAAIVVALALVGVSGCGGREEEDCVSADAKMAVEEHNEVFGRYGSKDLLAGNEKRGLSPSESYRQAANDLLDTRLANVAPSTDLGNDRPQELARMRALLHEFEKLSSSYVQAHPEVQSEVDRFQARVKQVAPDLLKTC